MVLRTTQRTELTCNCLLSPPTTTGDPSLAKPLYAASYELQAKDTEKAAHVGSVSVVENPLNTATGTTLSESAVHKTDSDFPGVFDVVALPPSTLFLPNASSSDSNASERLLVSCTDGGVRVLSAQTLELLDHFPAIHEEMITSCTPVVFGPSNDEAGNAMTGDALQLLCTAHTGSVSLFDTCRREVVQQLCSHEFDAWCGASLPGIFSADASILLLSGGDDGLCLVHDRRMGATPAQRMRFGAGVVSITPILGDDGMNLCSQPTPYVLVGSYDESISLMDLRSCRRPVSEATSLGGGVWRTSRTLFPSSSSPCSGGHITDQLSLLRNCPTSFVGPANVLVLPLMQRGAAMLPYNINLPSERIFGDILYLTAEEELSSECLVYDTAVLRCTKFEQDDSAYAATIATCSFYERCVSQWDLNLHYNREEATLTCDE